MYRRALAAILAFATALPLASGAGATIFQRDYHDAGVWTAYDDVNSTYSMKFNAGSKDGFWLVTSTGENPKSNAQEYAILYGDLTANRISAYVYDGVNSANSFRSTDFLGSFEAPFSDMGGGMVQFDLDVAKINSTFTTSDWEGVRIGSKAGIWFHQSADSSFQYGSDGALLDYAFGSQMWLDRAFDPTFKQKSPKCAKGKTASGFANPCSATDFDMAMTSSGGDTSSSSGGGAIPVPGGLAFILIGAAGFAMRRRG